MSYAFGEITFLTSDQRTASENGLDFDVSKYSEMEVFLEITAQGAFTSETLDVVLQTKSPNGKYHTKGSFTQVGDATSALPYYQTLELANLGKMCRVVATLTGGTEDYTFSVTGVAKRII